MAKKMQLKLLGLERVELKFDGDKGLVEGYASTFGGAPDSYGDIIAAGAFAKTLVNRSRPIRMRWNHYGPVIGKWTSIEEDEKGLKVKGELTPGHSVAADVYASLKHGAIDGLSIGYYVVESDKQKDGTTLLKAVDLVEISVVEEPANTSATISQVKSDIDSAQSLKDIETILRDAGGFSNSEAKALISLVKALPRDEAEAEKTPDVTSDVFESLEFRKRG
jgi:HK97 family phage prohead protease